MINLEIKNNDCHAALAMTKSVQSGRSMIEMLGVLAIIGVLSVGGIAGYSKAMQKYRINKAIEQITLIAGNVRTFFASQGNYEGVNDDKVIKKAKLVPDEMWDGNNIRNVFGDTVLLHSTGKFKRGDAKAFVIEYVTPTDNEEVCIELFTHDWSDAGIRSILAHPVYTKAKKLPIDINDAVTMCSNISEAGKQGLGSSFAMLLSFETNDECLKGYDGYGVCGL
ncbi:MAG: hypothetical protein IJ525_04560 [Alphaproteobacteria bacterium]|nr:hypothetical protein [Alphaproteobacteria bacterium]